MKFRFVLFFTCLIPKLIAAQNILTFNNATDTTLDIEKNCKVRVYQKGIIPSVEDIKKDIGFEDNTKNYIRIDGNENEKVWIKLIFHNQTQEDIYLENLNPLTKNYSLYAIENGQLNLLQEAGTDFPFKNRSLHINTPNVALRPSKEPLTYLIAIENYWFFSLNLKVNTAKVIAEKHHHHDILNGAFVGCMLILIFFNMFIYSRLREIKYFSCSLYLTSMTIYILNFKGYFFEYFIPDQYYLNNFILISQGLAGLTGAYFVAKFMKFKDFLPVVNTLIKYVYVFYIVNIILTVFGYLTLSVYMVYLSSPIILIILFSVAPVLWPKGSKEMRLSIISWVFFAIGVSIYIANNIGLFHYALMTDYAIELGLGIQGFFMSLAVAHRFGELKIANTENQALIIQALEDKRILMEEKNKMLEESMKGKTVALESAMSKVNESEIKLEEYAKQLEKSNRELTEFAHIASHDLKAPIRGILSFAQLLERRNKAKFDHVDSEYFEYIKYNASHSSRLIDDLLSYSKIDKNLGEPNDIDLNDTLFLVSKSLQNVIDERKANIIYAELPILRGHSSLFQHLFQNIINNGIKYNKSEFPIIDINAIPNENGELIFSISDNGIGIPEHNQKEVFAMFRRLHNQTEYEGTGIGLAFCTRIVETYGGRIWLTSEVGVGTTFYFILPKATLVDNKAHLNRVEEVTI
jgi:signal transduction histidine kinase